MQDMCSLVFFFLDLVATEMQRAMVYVFNW